MVWGSSNSRRLEAMGYTVRTGQVGPSLHALPGLFLRGIRRFTLHPPDTDGDGGGGMPEDIGIRSERRFLTD